MSKAILRFALATVLTTALLSCEAIAQAPDDQQNLQATPTQSNPTPRAQETQPAEPQSADVAESLLGRQGPSPVTRTGFHAYVYSVAHDFGAMPTMKSTYAVLGGAGLLAAAVHNQDTRVNAHFQGGNTRIFAAGQYIGQSYTIGARTA